MKLAKESRDVILRSFHGGNTVHQLLCKHGTNRIIVPVHLQKRVVQWYNELLCHPGETRMELTISQHLTWKGLQRSVHDICKKCHTCQIAKTTKHKYGHIPEKSPEVKPWDVLCVDMIGPYTIPRKKGKDLILWAVTMIDPATGWFEIADVSTKQADVVANVVEQT